MADNFCNPRLDLLNYAQNTNNTDQITCRLCKRVFRSNQALITHIDSHMAHEEGVIRRLYSINHINPQTHASHLFSPSFPMPMQLQETRNFPDNNSILQPMALPQQRRNSFFSASQVGTSTPIRQMQLSPQVLSCAGNNNAAEIARLPIPPQVPQRKREEESPIDGTRAYIMQLEKPIKKIDFIDLVNMDDDNSDVEPLNLALKL